MFKTMTSVLDPKKHPSAEEINKIPSFIFCRWLSGNMYTIHASNQINMFHDIPIENQYNMIKSVFSGKIKYIPYPNAQEINNHKNVQYLSKHFNISEEKAYQYLELIDKNELHEIVQMYSDYELKKG